MYPKELEQKGTVSVIRDLGLKEPYVGQYPITNGEIAEDLTAYYANSEQVPSSLHWGLYGCRRNCKSRRIYRSIDA